MKSVEEFITFAKSLKGDEKGEAQTFLNHFFQIFGYEDVVTAGGSFESRIKFADETTKFADCLFAPIGHAGVLIEMKKRAEKNLEKHFAQVRDYWIEMDPATVIGQGAQKPRYIILCNFDEFIIYDYLSFADKISTGSEIFQKWKLKIICSRRFVPEIFISKNNQIKTDFLFQLVYNEFHILNRK